jgi:tetratricopeptide (TPR) repeat protein
MPRRPRQHVTEEKSRRSFRSVLPPEWVFRDATPDYGLDGEVEIFAEGKTTGLLFKAQLKGTNDDDLVVRLPHEMAEYYGSLGQPVLVVLYHEPSEKLYARWLQSYDPELDPPGKASIPIRFRPEDEIDRDNIDRLRGEVEVHRRLRDRRSAEPLRLAIARSADLIAGVSTAAVARSLQDIAREMPTVIRLSRDPTGDELGTMTLAEDGIFVSCHGLATSTLHYPVPWPVDPDLDQVVADAMVTVGLLVHRIGAIENAARIFASYARDSLAARNEGLVGPIANAFTTTHRIKDAIALIEALPEETARAMLFAMSLTWTARIDTLSADEQQEVVDYLTRRAATEEQQSEPRIAAASHYTLANRLRALHRHSDAVDHYRRAAELDPTYLDRSYFHGELAGALFENHEFEGASREYERALDQGADDSLRALLADSLLLSGRYSAAESAFAALEEPHASNPEWRLKLRLLTAIGNLGLGAQARDIEAAPRLADVSSDELSDDQRRAQLRAALAVDALCPLAWFNLGFLEHSLGNFVEAEEAFSNAAVLSRGDLDAFVRAIVLGLATGSAYTRDVVRIGYFFNRAELIHALSHGIDAPAEVQTSLMNFVEAALDDEFVAEGRDDSVTLRFVTEGGAFEQMIVGLD